MIFISYFVHFFSHEIMNVPVQYSRKCSVKIRMIQFYQKHEISPVNQRNQAKKNEISCKSIVEAENLADDSNFCFQY
jgi:hypothetical protein